MNGFLYTLTLKEPVLAATLAGDQNSAASLFYIPGSAVRGAFIQKFDGEKDAARDPFRRLFLSDETRFLNAYPLVDDKRALPAPLTWQVERKPISGQDKKVYRNVNCAKDKLGHPLDTKSIPFLFWLPDKGGSVNLFSVDEQWQVNVHTQRDAGKGRATTENGAIYRYIALPAGMKLQGAVLTQDADKVNKVDDAQTLRGLFGKKAEILLGKARTAGYGAATLEITDLPPAWREGGGDYNSNSKVTLTLLSPAMVRDDNGQFTLDVENALKARLGTGAAVKTISRHDVMIGGFNRTWGLPLPQATAIATGSVFHVYGATDESLKKLEETGFGERRAEGFGRVAVNLDLPADVMDWKKAKLDLELTATGSLNAADPLAKMMLKRLLRRDLDEQVVRAARTMTMNYMSAENKIAVPNSQLSRWRVILRDALQKENIQRVSDFCEKSKGKSGWKKMEKARLFLGQDETGKDKTMRLTDWIESVLQSADPLTQSFEPNFNPKSKLGAVTLSVADYYDEYRLRLIDAVLAVMSKKSGGKDG